MSVTRQGLLNWAAAQIRDYNQECQAFIYQICKAFGSAPKIYGSARLAAADSGWLNPSLVDVPLGAIGYWRLGTKDHVAISLGGDNWLCGTAHSGIFIGTSAHHIALIEAASYDKASGATWEGHSASNGRNTVMVLPDAVAAPLPGNFRTIGAKGAYSHTSADSDAASRAVLLPAGGQFAFQRFTVGEAVGDNDVWFETADGHFVWSGGTTDESTHDLLLLIALPPPVTAPTPPVPDPEPAPPILAPVTPAPVTLPPEIVPVVPPVIPSPIAVPVKVPKPVPSTPPKGPPVTIVSPAPISSSLTSTIEDDAAKLVDAANFIAPKDVVIAFAWYQRYAKGIVTTVGTLSTLALAIFPPVGPIYHWADLVFGAATIVTTIAIRNAPAAASN